MAVEPTFTTYGGREGEAFIFDFDKKASRNFCKEDLS
jgi:hypothetical protein